jgi:23S rRNA pseudouridine1911/1915/1917 synthase
LTAEEERRKWAVDESGNGQRIDKWLSSLDGVTWSRMMVQAWIRAGRVRVDGREVKVNYRLKEGETVALSVPPVEEIHIEPEAIPLDVRYEDQDVIVVNKPRGMVVHPAPGNLRGTLVNALLAHCNDLSGIGGVIRPGIVHRLDKDTSGLIMAAKNDEAHQALAAQLKAHRVERIYAAVVYGEIPHDRGTVDAPIGRDPRHRQRMAVVHRTGKRAVTHFVVRERFRGATLVECRLETGRTHQIRVHMQYIGYPLIGDLVYGPKKKRYAIERQALHARVLGFEHPRTGERIRLEAELPEDMEELLAQLRAESL